MNTAVFARLFLYFILSFSVWFYYFWYHVVVVLSYSKEEVACLATAARGLASSWRISISASRSGSKLSFSSFTPVFPAADRQIRPRQRKRVTNLPLITILVDTFVLINPDRVECARSSGQVLQRSQWASVQVETKESGQKTTFRWWWVMEAGLFTHKLALRVKTRDPRLGLNR